MTRPTTATKRTRKRASFSSKTTNCSSCLKTTNCSSSTWFCRCLLVGDCRLLLVVRVSVQAIQCVHSFSTSKMHGTSGWAAGNSRLLVGDCRLLLVAQVTIRRRRRSRRDPVRAVSLLSDCRSVVYSSAGWMREPSIMVPGVLCCLSRRGIGGWRLGLSLGWPMASDRDSDPAPAPSHTRG